MIHDVNALGLNYQTEVITIKSGEDFCLEGYFMYNIEEKEEAGYLDLDENLAVFTPQYNLLKEKNEWNTELSEIKQKIKELNIIKKNPSDNISDIEKEMGLLDNQLQKINLEIDIINKQLNNITKIITIAPGLDKIIREQFKGNSKGLRDYISSNGLLKELKLCLKAPEIENEISGDCYTKYYRGSVLLILISNKTAASGSSVSARVGAPLEIQVRCKNLPSEGINYILLICIMSVVLLIILFLIIQHIIVRKKRKHNHY
jgi:hypothetical protein